MPIHLQNHKDIDALKVERYDISIGLFHLR